MELNTHFDELLDFPCVFAFKVMGVAGPELMGEVLTVIQKNAPGDYAPTVKPSSKGTYQALSVPVTVTSKEQIEAIYNELNNLESVRYIL
jgi:putative lipoic acid-binding regulatory protein